MQQSAWWSQANGEHGCELRVGSRLLSSSRSATAHATMSRSGKSRLMAVEEGRLVAVIALKDLLSFLSLKLDLEAHPSRPFGSCRHKQRGN
jgi:hypothetical protein